MTKVLDEYWQDRAEAAEARVEDCAQALRAIRDTTTGVAANIAHNTLIEAGIPDPPEDDEFS